jgi:hypothetical protein
LPSPFTAAGVNGQTVLNDDDDEFASALQLLKQRQYLFPSLSAICMSSFSHTRRHGKGSWLMVRDACRKVSHLGVKQALKSYGGDARVERGHVDDGYAACFRAQAAVMWSRDIDEAAVFAS